jgi:hypothetical protein
VKSEGGSGVGDLLVIHDYGNSIEAVIFAGGKEIARVKLSSLAALFAGQQLIEAASIHLRREKVGKVTP